MKYFVFVIPFLLFYSTILAQKRYFGDKLSFVFAPIGTDTFDVCKIAACYAGPEIRFKNETHDKIIDYQNSMILYFMENKQKQWEMIGNEEQKLFFDLCKSSVIDTGVKFNFSQNADYLLKSIKFTPERKLGIFTTGINYFGFRYGYNFYANLPLGVSLDRIASDPPYYRKTKDTTVRIKMVLRKPISKNEYLEEEKIIYLTNKSCNHAEEESALWKAFLDTVQIQNPNLKIDERLEASLALQFMEKYKGKINSETFIGTAYKPFYPKRGKYSKKDSVDLQEKAYRILYEDTLFAKIISKVPTQRFNFLSIHRDWSYYLRAFDGQYELQVKLMLQLLSLCAKANPTIRRGLPEIFQYIKNEVINEYNKAYHKAISDPRVQNYAIEVSKL